MTRPSKTMKASEFRSIYKDVAGRELITQPKKGDLRVSMMGRGIIAVESKKVLAGHDGVTAAFLWIKALMGTSPSGKEWTLWLPQITLFLEDERGTKRAWTSDLHVFPNGSTGTFRSEDAIMETQGYLTSGDLHRAIVGAMQDHDFFLRDLAATQERTKALLSEDDDDAQDADDRDRENMQHDERELPKLS